MQKDINYKTGYSYTSCMLQPNLNWWCSKYAKIGHVHYFSTIALRVTSNTPRSVYMRIFYMGIYLYFVGNIKDVFNCKSLIYHI